MRKHSIIHYRPSAHLSTEAFFSYFPQVRPIVFIAIWAVNVIFLSENICFHTLSADIALLTYFSLSSQYSFNNVGFFLIFLNLLLAFDLRNLQSETSFFFVNVFKISGVERPFLHTLLKNLSIVTWCLQIGLFCFDFFSNYDIMNVEIMERFINVTIFLSDLFICILIKYNFSHMLVT